MMKQLIGSLIMWYCQSQLRKYRKSNGSYSIFEIMGIGKDFPRYLIYTDQQHVSDKMKSI